MRPSFHLFRIAGVDIGVHYTWLFAFVLIGWSLAVGYYPSFYPGWSTSTYWGLGAVSSILLFTSVLVHEMAHSLVARRLGLRVLGITLFIFGGVSNMQGEAQRARDEFYVAVVGPVTSLLLAGIFALPLLFTKGPVGQLGALLGYLALINALLGGFNLLPGFPLDGGRILRSILWGITGTLAKATIIASRVGQVFAFGLIGWGIYQIVTGNFLSGLWIMFIGWFLNSAAESNRREAKLQEEFRDVFARDLMDTQPETTSPETSVISIVEELFLRRGKRALLVCDELDQLVGVVTLTDLKKARQELWPNLKVADVMTGQPIHTVGPDEDASKVLQLLAEHDLNQVPVVEDGKVVGMLNRSDMIRYIQARKELGLGRRRRR